ncbi:hypothetical protein EV193_106313 [Herbihabitans rhizosphaerae]|uniref:Uncharacterized protein n=1 Tax=Herbihabitans rhizosphaerae TaxID=1872711 RepID=A0A4Q7KLE8_9PSEU|nr:hypothetical protein [Herbihabitans rhizosphaerae]RZS37077.1 hypothetical protein EV193_106313 [Herbihabitans rhizosphaerae]
MAEISHHDAISRYPELAQLVDQRWSWEERPLPGTRGPVLWGSRQANATHLAAQVFIYSAHDVSVYWRENGIAHTAPPGELSTFIEFLAYGR